MNFYQVALPIFTVIYLLQVFVIQSWIQYRKTGIKPYVFGTTDSPHDYCGKVYRIMVIATWVSITLYSFFPGHYQLLTPIRYLQFEWLQHVGFGLALLSLIWIVIAQNQMAASWRIGINYQEKTMLKTTGLFGYSRNPIFLGVIVSYIGTFLIIPNALSFAVLMLTFIVLQIQVRLEEEYLKETQGRPYIDYLKSVKRWI